jgi:hypothetical protein
VEAGRKSQQAAGVEMDTDREFCFCRPASLVETPSLQTVLSATAAITAASKPQSNTLAPQIRTRTLFTVAIVGNTNIAFLTIHAVGGVDLRVRAASVVDCSLVAVAKTRAADETGRRQCGFAGVLAAGAHIAAAGYLTPSKPLHVASGPKKARRQESRPT